MTTLFIKQQLIIENTTEVILSSSKSVKFLAPSFAQIVRNVLCIFITIAKWFFFSSVGGCNRTGSRYNIVNSSVEIVEPGEDNDDLP